MQGRSLRGPSSGRFLAISIGQRRAGCGRSSGGGPLTEDRLEGGWYVAPTVYVGVSNNSPIAREEIFCPVLCVIPFEDEGGAAPTNPYLRRRSSQTAHARMCGLKTAPH